MTLRILKHILAAAGAVYSLSGCLVLRENAKHNFNDGIYQTRQFSDNKVYVLKVDEDTIAVFPVLEFKDSTAILAGKRINYTSKQKKLRDGLVSHSFYHPSFDIDVMTIPVVYRPAAGEVPGQLTSNFNGALYGGYRMDEYRLNYKRTPLNTYKQSVKHSGYSAGLFAGLGNTFINATTLDKPNYFVDYEGVVLITGVAANVAAGNFTFGISCGPDFLLDKNSTDWIYKGKLCLGFTVGLNLN
jgi:hypothetical protein